MVEAGQDVVYTQHGVIPGHLPGGMLADDLNVRLAGARNRCGLGSIQPEETRKHISNGGLQSYEANNIPGNVTARHSHKLPMQVRIWQSFDDRFTLGLPLLGQSQSGRVWFLEIDRRPPHDFVPVLRQLTDFQRTWLQLMGKGLMRKAGAHNQQEKQFQVRPRHLHCACPVCAVAITLLSRTGASAVASNVTS